MALRKLRTTTATKLRAVLLPAFEGPVLVGTGGDDYLCPNCEAVIAKQVPPRIFEIVVHCQRCGADSAFPALPPGIMLGPAAAVSTGRYMLSSHLTIAPGAAMIGADAKGKIPEGSNVKAGPTPGLN